MRERKNHDTVTDLKSTIRPVIAINDTHMKGIFRGILFMAACSDGNEQVSTCFRDKA
ncbi:hypothetical protein Ddye_007162 [Dipteronia dyeriana]|uniref:Uncharacterized protein n=1 Tax=Dipteronia dyeriana TaxID=168575 RepID=A0AAD9XJE9_9ROSI|nr:hypothetical protein Ddye_007162 [Dipteronia dyeriana]